MPNETNFYYDPKRQGYNTNLWKTISGSPAVSSNKLRVSNAEIIHYGDALRGFFNLVAFVPATPTNAYLTGGTGATSVPATWAAVTDGDFAITIDGVVYDITAIDFTGAATMAAVAVILQAAIRAATSDSHTTVAWSTDHFLITSRKSITVTSTSPTAPGTDISGAGATAFMDSDVGAADEAVTAATNTNKKWGLTQLNKDLKLYFELRGDTLIAVSSDEGGTSQETEIVWDTDWQADTEYEISWRGQFIKFMIAGSVVAMHDTRIPRSPMSLYIKNELADNLDFKFFEGKGIESFV